MAGAEDPETLELTEQDRLLVTGADTAGAVAALQQATAAADAAGARRALRVLCELVVAGHAAAAAAAGAPDGILACLRSPLFAQSAVVRQAVAALGHLANSGDAHRAACVDAGALGVVIGAMAQHKQQAAVQQLCSRFLALAMHKDPDAQREAADADAFAGLTRAVGAHPASADVVAEALGALGVVTDRAALRQLAADGAAVEAARASLVAQWSSRADADRVALAAARVLLHHAAVVHARHHFGQPAIAALLSAVTPPGDPFGPLPRPAPLDAVHDAARALALLAEQSAQRQLIHDRPGAVLMLWRATEGGKYGVEVTAVCAQVVARMLAVASVHSLVSPEQLAARLLALLQIAPSDPAAVVACLVALGALSASRAAHRAVVVRDDIMRALAAAYDDHKENASVASALVTCIRALLGHTSEARVRIGNFGWVGRCMHLADLHSKEAGVVRSALSAAALMCSEGTEHQATVLSCGGLKLAAQLIAARKDPHDLATAAAELVEAMWGPEARQAVAEAGLARGLVSRVAADGAEGGLAVAPCIRALASQVAHRGAPGGPAERGARLNAAELLAAQGAEIVFAAANGSEGGGPVRSAALQALSNLSAYAATLPSIAALPIGDMVRWAAEATGEAEAAAMMNALAALLYSVAAGTPRAIEEGGARKVTLPRAANLGEAPLRPFGLRAAAVRQDAQLGALVASAAQGVASVAPAAMGDPHTAAALAAAAEAAGLGAAESLAAALSQIPTEAHEAFVTEGGLQTALGLLAAAPSATAATQALHLCAAVIDIPPGEAADAAAAGDRGAGLLYRLGLDEMELQMLSAAVHGQGRHGRSQDAWVCSARLALSSAEWRKELQQRALQPVTRTLELHLALPDPPLVMCLGSLLLSLSARDEVAAAAPKLVPTLLALAPHPDKLAGGAVLNPTVRAVAWVGACAGDYPAWMNTALDHRIDDLIRAVIAEPSELGAQPGSIPWGNQMRQQGRRSLKVYQLRREEEEEDRRKRVGEENTVLDTVDPRLRRRLDEEGDGRPPLDGRARAAAAQLVAARGGFQFTQEEAEALQRKGALRAFLQRLSAERHNAGRLSRLFACLAQAVTDAREAAKLGDEEAESAVMAAWGQEPLRAALAAIADQGHDVEVFVRGCWYLGALAVGGEGGEAGRTAVAQGAFASLSRDVHAVQHSPLAGPAAGDLIRSLLPSQGVEEALIESGLLRGLATLLRAHPSDAAGVHGVAAALAALSPAPATVRAIRRADLPRCLLGCLGEFGDDEEAEEALLAGVRAATRRLRGEDPPPPDAAGPQGVPVLVGLLRARWGRAVDVQRSAAALLADLSQAPGAGVDLDAAQVQQLVLAVFADDGAAVAPTAVPPMSDVPSRAYFTVPLAALLPHSAELRVRIGDDAAAAAVLKELSAARGHGAEATLACLAALELLSLRAPARRALAVHGAVAKLSALANREDAPAGREVVCCALECLLNLATEEGLRTAVATQGGLSCALSILRGCPEQDRHLARVACGVIANTCSDCAAAQRQFAALGGPEVLGRAVMRWEADPEVLPAAADATRSIDVAEVLPKCECIVVPLAGAVRAMLHACSVAPAESEERDAAAAACASALGAAEALCRGCGANQDAVAENGVDALCAALAYARSEASPRPGAAALLRRALGLSATVSFAEMPPTAARRLAGAFASAAAAALRLAAPLPHDALACAATFASSGLDTADALVEPPELLRAAAAASRVDPSLGALYADFARCLAAEPELRQQLGSLALRPLLLCVQRARRDPLVLARALAALGLLLRDASCQQGLLSMAPLDIDGSPPEHPCSVLARTAGDAAGRSQEVLRLAADCLAALPADGSSAVRSAADALSLSVSAHSGNVAAVGGLCEPLARWARSDAAVRTALRRCGVMDTAHDLLVTAGSASLPDALAAPVLILGAQLHHNDPPEDRSDGTPREAFLWGQTAAGLDTLLDALPVHINPQSTALQAIGWCLGIAVVHGDETITDRVTAKRGAAAIAVAAQSPLIQAEDRRLCGEAIDKIRLEEARRAADAGLSLEDMRAALRKAERAQEVAEQRLRDQESAMSAARLEAVQCKEKAERAEAETKDKQKLIDDLKVRHRLELETQLADARRSHRAELTAMGAKLKAQLSEHGRLGELMIENEKLKQELDDMYQEREELRLRNEAKAAAMADMQQQELREIEDRYRSRVADTLHQHNWDMANLQAERKAVAEREEQGRSEAENRLRELRTANVELETRLKILQDKVEELARECATQERQLRQRNEAAALHAAELKRLEHSWEQRRDAAVERERNAAERKVEELRTIHAHKEAEIRRDTEKAMKHFEVSTGGMIGKAQLAEAEQQERKALRLEQRQARQEMRAAHETALAAWRAAAEDEHERGWRDRLQREVADSAFRARRPEQLRGRRLQRTLQELGERAAMLQQDFDAVADHGAEHAGQLLQLQREEAAQRALVVAERQEGKRRLRLQRQEELRDGMNRPLVEVRSKVSAEYGEWAAERDRAWRRHADEVDAQAAQRVREQKEVAAAQRQRVSAQVEEIKRKHEEREKHHRQQHSMLTTQLAQAVSQAKEELRMEEKRRRAASIHARERRQSEIASLQQEHEAEIQRLLDESAQREVQVKMRLGETEAQRDEARHKQEQHSQQAAALEEIRKQELESVREQLGTASRESQRAQASSASSYRAAVAAICAAEGHARRALEDAAELCLALDEEAAVAARSAGQACAAAVLHSVYTAPRALEARQSVVAAITAGDIATEAVQHAAAQLSMADALVEHGGLGMDSCAVATFRHLREHASGQPGLEAVDAMAAMGVAATDGPAIGADGPAVALLADGVWGMVGAVCDRLRQVDEEHTAMRAEYVQTVAQLQHSAEVAQEHVRVLQAELSRRSAADSEEREIEVVQMQQRLTAAERATQRVVDELVQSHEAEMAQMRRQLQLEEQLSDRLRTTGDPDFAHPEYVARLRRVTERATTLDAECRQQSRAISQLKESLREAENERRRAQTRAAEAASLVQRLEEQLHEQDAALREVQAAVETAREGRRKDGEEAAQRLKEAHAEAARERQALENRLQEVEHKVMVLNGKLRRHDIQRDEQGKHSAVLRKAGIDACIECIERQTSEIHELEGSLREAKEQCEKMRRAKDAALGEMERAIAKESSVMNKYLKVLAARDGVLQREKELESKAWEAALKDGQLEQRERDLMKREVELRRAPAAGAMAAHGGSRPHPAGYAAWASDRLGQADRVCKLSREELYTTDLPRPQPRWSLQGMQQEAEQPPRNALLHKPLPPLRDAPEPPLSRTA